MVVTLKEFLNSPQYNKYDDMVIAIQSMEYFIQHRIPTDEVECVWKRLALSYKYETGHWPAPTDFGLGYRQIAQDAREDAISSSSSSLFRLAENHIRAQKKLIKNAKATIKQQIADRWPGTLEWIADNTGGRYTATIADTLVASISFKNAIDQSMWTLWATGRVK